MEDKHTRDLEAKVARYEETNKLLWATIDAIENWAHGEGVFITPTLSKKIDASWKAVKKIRQMDAARAKRASAKK